MLALTALCGFGAAPQGAFTPADVAGLALWVDFGDLATLYQDSSATTPVAADSDPIGHAADKSGSGNHLVQATSAARPTYKAAVKNGRSVSRWDGADDQLVRDVSGMLFGYQQTIFWVGKTYRGAALRFIFDTGNDSGLSRRNFAFNATNIVQFARDGGGGNMALTLPADDAWGLIAGKFDGSNSVLRLNGGSEVTGVISTTSTASGNPFSLGRRYVFGSESYGRDMGELLVYNAALTAGQIAQVEAYLNAKWGVY